MRLDPTKTVVYARLLGGGFLFRAYPLPGQVRWRGRIEDGKRDKQGLPVRYISPVLKASEADLWLTRHFADRLAYVDYQHSEGFHTYADRD